jgi:hypothetical protein
VTVHVWVIAQVLLQVRRELVEPDAVYDRDAEVAADHLAAVLQFGLDLPIPVDDFRLAR